MIVGKAVNLAHNLNVPAIGLVENMAYFKCDECGKKHNIFGEPQGAAVAEKYAIPSWRRFRSILCSPAWSTRARSRSTMSRALRRHPRSYREGGRGEVTSRFE